MTQGPQGGQSAPMSTGFQTASSARPATAATGYEPGNGPGSSGTPSPSTPTTSTPWGSTSTAAGSPPNPTGSPMWTSTPIGTADAPTSAVPLVEGTGTAARPAASGPAPSAQAASAANRSARGARPRGPRRARLQLRHINPWTVLKFSCVLSIALFFVWLIVIGVLFGVLDGAGVIDKINTAYTDIQPGSAAPVRASIVFGGAAIIGVINIVLFIALTTVGAVVYNLCADLVGGIEITLSER
ncbi:MAG TPA: DUF3566 domain-containing protein [Jatrophihabitans sp.]|nr:DUF3566 domain-containing protein [Jatrophihabitans sp.]